MPSPTGAAAVRPMPPVADALLRALLAGERWASGTLSYSFPERNAVFAANYGGQGAGRSEPLSPYYDPLTASDRQNFASALAAWAAVADLTFVPVVETATNVGDLRVAYTWLQEMEGYEAWAYTPAADTVAGDIWLNGRARIGEEEWQPGTGSFATVLHEIGHALGLKHPFDPPEVLPAQWDVQSYTVMSYSATAGRPASTFDYHPTTPMLLDIAALQLAYGPNMRQHAGDNVHAFDDAARYHETLWDAGGHDVLRYDGALPAVIDLRAGYGSLLGQRVHALDAQGRHEVPNVWIARGVLLEDAIGGSAADTITGNEGANFLRGRGGNDRLLAGDGHDLLEGGAGDDQIDGGAGRDTAMYAGPAAGYAIGRTGGTLTVSDRSGAEGLDTLTGVERLRFAAHEEIAWDIDGNAGQAYRLYRAALARTPDEAGLGYQVHTLDTGVPLAQVASHFMQSPEFVRNYGALDAPAFVTQLYRNVLQRAPEEAGLQYHLARLAGGVSREDVLIGFSESPENQAQVIGAIEGGIHYTV